MVNNENVTIDLTGYKDKMGSRVPEGRYKVQVSDTELDNSKAGNDMINVWLDIVDGEEAGQTLVDRLVLSPKSLFRVVGFMQAIGLQTPKKRLNINIKSWVGKVLEVDVEDGEPFNNKVRSEIRGYNRVAKRSADTRTDIPDVPDAESVAAGDGLSEFVERDRETVADPVTAPLASVPDTVDLDTLDL